MDIGTRCATTGRTWDLLDPTDQAKARRMLQKDKPELLVASPPCTRFSNLQNLNKKEWRREERDKAIAMVDCSGNVCASTSRRQEVRI